MQQTFLLVSTTLGNDSGNSGSSRRYGSIPFHLVLTTNITTTIITTTAISIGSGW